MSTTTVPTDHFELLRRAVPWATELDPDGEGGVELRRYWGGEGLGAPVSLVAYAQLSEAGWEVDRDLEIVVDPGRCKNLGADGARQLAGWLTEAAEQLEAAAMTGPAPVSPAAALSREPANLRGALGCPDPTRQLPEAW